MSPQLKPVPRRRRGDSWTLWAVCRSASLSPSGYLVTAGGGRAAPPVAFVPGANARSLALALAIRADNGRAGGSVHARDLRGRQLPPPPVLGRLLLPVDAIGRVIRNDSTFSAARFVGPSAYAGPKGAFFTYTHAGLEGQSEYAHAAQKESGEPGKVTGIRAGNHDAETDRSAA